MIVKELITILQTFDQELQVGAIGHFDELIEIDEIYLEESEDGDFIAIETDLP